MIKNKPAPCQTGRDRYSYEHSELEYLGWGKINYPHPTSTRQQVAKCSYPAPTVRGRKKMKQDKTFSQENFLLSVLGHLVLVAVMITSFVIVVNRAMLVAPDRVQITEIDLSNVKITRDDTSLHNTAAPQTKQETGDKRQETGDDKPIEKPTMVENETGDKRQETRRRTVKVNREVVSLNRTMTVSVVDALRVRLTRCWVVDTGRADIRDIRAVRHLTLYKNGKVRDVWFESAARADADPAFAYVLGTIRDAIVRCRPFNMLPVGEFDAWEKIQLTFYPVRGQIL